MYDDQQLIDTIQNHNATQASQAEGNASAWRAWADLLDDVLDQMPAGHVVSEMDECGENSWVDTGAEHIDTKAMRASLTAVRSNADAIAVAYHRTAQKLTARTERRTAELAEDFAALDEVPEPAEVVHGG